MRLCHVKGLGREEGERIEAVMGTVPVISLEEFVRRTSLNLRALTALAEAGAFERSGLDRRTALWEVRGLARGDPEEMPFLRRERPSAFTPKRLDRRRAARRRYLQAARAPTQHLGCFLVREWYNPYPHGPASETTCSGLLCECSFRISLSISLWRVPIVPKERTAASCSSATEATEIVSLWPSRPTRRVLSCALADLRVYQNDSESIMWRWPRTG